MARNSDGANVVEVLRSGVGLRSAGDFEQKLHGNAAVGARAVLVVEGRALALEQYAVAGAFFIRFGGGEPLDDLGAAVPLGRARSGMDDELAATVGAGWTGGLVLHRQAGMASPADLHLSALGNRSSGSPGISAWVRSDWHTGCSLVGSKRSKP